MPEISPREPGEPQEFGSNWAVHFPFVSAKILDELTRLTRFGRIDDPDVVVVG